MHNDSMEVPSNKELFENVIKEAIEGFDDEREMSDK